MTSQELTQANLAALVANLLAKEYGSPEAAAVALQQQLDSNDLSQVRAGVKAAGESMSKMAQAATAQPEAMAAAVASRIATQPAQ